MSDPWGRFVSDEAARRLRAYEEQVGDAAIQLAVDALAAGKCPALIRVWRQNGYPIAEELRRCTVQGEHGDQHQAEVYGTVIRWNGLPMPELRPED